MLLEKTRGRKPSKMHRNIEYVTQFVFLVIDTKIPL